jgi:hypothetical protein
VVVVVVVLLLLLVVVVVVELVVVVVAAACLQPLLHQEALLPVLVLLLRMGHSRLYCQQQVQLQQLMQELEHVQGLVLVALGV